MFKISRDGKVMGDYTFFEVVDGLSDSRFTGSDYFWTPGMKAWRSLHDFAEFNQSFKPPTESNSTNEKSSATDNSDENRPKPRQVEPHCPTCHSRSVQSFEMGYASGTRQFESVGFSSRGRASYRTGHSSTLLASSLSPPDKSSGSVIYIIFFVLGLIGLYLSLTFPGNTLIYSASAVSFSGFCFWQWGKSTAIEDAEYQKAMEEWKTQWFCKKCGAIFTLKEAEED